MSAVGPSQAHHNLYPFQTRPLAGEPLRVVAERVDMQGHTLRWLISRIDPSRPYYLLGEVEIADGKGPALTGRLDSVEWPLKEFERLGMKSQVVILDNII